MDKTSDTVTEAVRLDNFTVGYSLRNNQLCRGATIGGKFRFGGKTQRCSESGIESIAVSSRYCLPKRFPDYKIYIEINIDKFQLRVKYKTAFQFL